MNEYHCGFSILPRFIRAVLSQNPAVNSICEVHDMQYKVQALKRRKIDLIFFQQIIDQTGNIELATIYYNAVRYLGWCSWLFYKIKKFLKRREV